MAEIIGQIASSINLLETISHVCSTENIASILDNGLFGRKSLLEHGLKFREAALSQNDVKEGDFDSVCFGNLKIDESAFKEKSTVFELDFARVCEQYPKNSGFLKQFDPSVEYDRTPVNFSFENEGGAGGCYQIFMQKYKYEEGDNDDSDDEIYEEGDNDDNDDEIYEEGDNDDNDDEIYEEGDNDDEIDEHAMGVSMGLSNASPFYFKTDYLLGVNIGLLNAVLFYFKTDQEMGDFEIKKSGGINNAFAKSCIKDSFLNHCDLKNADAALILNFFKYIDSFVAIKDERGDEVSRFKSDFYLNLSRLNDDQLKDKLEEFGKQMAQQVLEVNFHGAFLMDFTCIKNIYTSKNHLFNLEDFKDSRSSVYVLNLPSFLSSLTEQRPDFKKLEEAQEMIPQLFQSYRFIDYLLKNVTNQELIKRLQESRSKIELPFWRKKLEDEESVLQMQNQPEGENPKRARMANGDEDSADEASAAACKDDKAVETTAGHPASATTPKKATTVTSNRSTQSTQSITD